LAPPGVPGMRGGPAAGAMLGQPIPSAVTRAHTVPRSIGAPRGLRPDASVCHSHSAIAGTHACMATAVGSGQTDRTLAEIMTIVAASIPSATFQVERRRRLYSRYNTISATSATSTDSGQT